MLLQREMESGGLLMTGWIARNKGKLAFAVAFLSLAAVGGWAYLYESLPGGVWHRNRITGATCYKTVHCWSESKDPFGKGLKLPSDPFGKAGE
jgi:hypothetical protein